MKFFDYKSHLEEGFVKAYEDQIERIYKLEESLKEAVSSQPDYYEKLQKDNIWDSSIKGLEIEGYKLDLERLEKLNLDGDLSDLEGLGKFDKEVLGYYDVLTTIHESYPYISINPNMILQLHRDLLRNVNSALGGNYRNACIFVSEIGENGEEIHFFEPVAAHETKMSLENLCDHYNYLQGDLEFRSEKLLLAIMFLLDFYLIHPFNFGNGEAFRFMSHLLTRKLDLGVFAIKGIEIFQKDIRSFYQVVKESANNHKEGLNDYRTFISYYLNLLEKAYQEII